MKVSIIIPTYNSQRFISYALESILSQGYENIECVVVDGGSCDNTLDILKKYKEKYEEKIIYFSEKDQGVFDALNKGIKKSSGELIGWMGADDFYANSHVVEKVVKIINEKGVDICWGDLLYVDKNNIEKVVRNWKSSQYKRGMFQKGWQLPHFASFVKKNVFDSLGYFNIEFRIAADYDFFLRILEKNNISSYYIPEVFLKMRIGGQSNRNIKNIIEGNVDCYKSWKHNELYFNPFTLFFFKIMRKIKQFF